MQKNDPNTVLDKAKNKSNLVPRIMHATPPNYGPLGSAFTTLLHTGDVVSLLQVCFHSVRTSVIAGKPLRKIGSLLV